VPSAQGGQTVFNVEELRREGSHPVEKLPSPGKIARPLVEVAKGVPLAKMAGIWVTKSLPTRSEEGDCPLEIAAVGHHPGYHEPAFDEHFSVHTGLT
jgi:hypothetical protein